MPSVRPALIIALPLLAACADQGAGYRPILDGVATAGFETDLAACQSLARNQIQFDQETMAAAGLGAGVGAVLGQAEGEDALGGAVAGALAGGIAAAVEGAEARKSIVIACMKGRGHAVVG